MLGIKKNKYLSYSIVYALEKFVILFPKEFVSDKKILGKMTDWQNSLVWTQITAYSQICTSFEHVINISSEISPHNMMSPR